MDETNASVNLPWITNTPQSDAQDRNGKNFWDFFQRPGNSRIMGSGGRPSPQSYQQDASGYQTKSMLSSPDMRNGHNQKSFVDGLGDDTAATPSVNPYSALDVGGTTANDSTARGRGRNQISPLPGNVIASPAGSPPDLSALAETKRPNRTTAPAAEPVVAVAASAYEQPYSNPSTYAGVPPPANSQAANVLVGASMAAGNNLAAQMSRLHAAVDLVVPEQQPASEEPLYADDGMHHHGGDLNAHFASADYYQHAPASNEAPAGIGGRTRSSRAKALMAHRFAQSLQEEPEEDEDWGRGRGSRGGNSVRGRRGGMANVPPAARRAPAPPLVTDPELLDLRPRFEVPYTKGIHLRLGEAGRRTLKALVQNKMHVDGEFRAWVRNQYGRVKCMTVVQLLAVAHEAGLWDAAVALAQEFARSKGSDLLRADPGLGEDMAGGEEGYGGLDGYNAFAPPQSGSLLPFMVHPLMMTQQQPGALQALIAFQQQQYAQALLAAGGHPLFPMAAMHPQLAAAASQVASLPAEGHASLPGAPVDQNGQPAVQPPQAGGGAP